ncbi:MAG: T9SS type A sorting domain-containing protein [Bacteroidaceae bacterium]|nr:T9SS type A sorting domain-containing protein [Bacteroidaceae bacterium]
MKKLLFTAALSTATFISASGQEVANFENIEFIPSSITFDGKAVPVGIDQDIVTILDQDFNVVKQIKNIKKASGEYRSYTEIATVKPTGATITESRNEDFTVDGNTITAPDLNSMIQKLSSCFEGYDFYGFTDSEGRLSCWSPQLSNFFYQQWLGTMYPEMYYAIIDGKVNRVHASYELVFDIDNAQWTPMDKEREGTHLQGIETFYFYDYDANIFNDESITFTQTLFNEDDKWEYLVPQLGPVEKHVGDYWQWDRNEDGVVLRRNVSESQSTIGYTIYNEDGNVVASIPFNDTSLYDVYKLGGNVYLMSSYHNDILYKYDPKTTSIKEVNRTEAKALSVKMRGRNIMVEGGQKADEAVLVDMGGRIVATSNRKGNESITINAANMPAGVYNVAVKNKGRLATAQKIILK